MDKLIYDFGFLVPNLLSLWLHATSANFKGTVNTFYRRDGILRGKKLSGRKRMDVQRLRQDILLAGPRRRIHNAISNKHYQYHCCHSSLIMMKHDGKPTSMRYSRQERQRDYQWLVGWSRV